MVVENGRFRFLAGWQWLLWLFAAVGFLGACAVILVALQIVRSLERQHPPPMIAAGGGAESFAVGEIAAVPGRDMVALEIDIVSGHESGMSSAYKQNDVRNIILLNQSTGVSRRLLPDNKHFIFDHKFLAAVSDIEKGRTAGSVDKQPGRPSATAPAAYYALEISDNNAKEGKPATHSLVVGSLDTGQQGVVVSGVQGISDMWMVDAKHLGIVVSQNEVLIYRIVDISALRVTRSTTINVG